MRAESFNDLTGKLLISIDIHPTNTNTTTSNKIYKLYRNHTLEIIELLPESEIVLHNSNKPNSKESNNTSDNLASTVETHHYIIEKFITKAIISDEAYNEIESLMTKHSGALRVQSMRANMRRYTEKLTPHTVEYKLICGLSEYELVFINILTDSISEYTIINKILPQLKHLELSLREQPT